MNTNKIVISKDQAVSWLKDLGVSTSGTKDELVERIRKFKRYPKLVDKLQRKCKSQYRFPCSLDPLSIPQVNANWQVIDKLLPKITQKSFLEYASQKLEGSQGQQEKAFQMVQSRKIVFVKTYQVDENTSYVKAMIKKSYGHESRPAVIFFSKGTALKGNCLCPVGISGLCCHILALLLFLKHYHETNEKLLELTCTQKLQVWHKRVSKGSIPMIPLKEIKVKSAKMKKDKKNLSVTAADPQKSYFKRDVSKIIEELNKKLDNEKPVSEHVYSVLSKSEAGRKTSVGEHLCYNFLLVALGDHQYIEVKEFEKYILGVDINKVFDCERKKIYDINNKPVTSFPNCSNNAIEISDIIQQNIIEIELITPNIVYQYTDQKSKDLHRKIVAQVNKQIKLKTKNHIHVNISFSEAPKPHGTNYVNVKQNTKDWFDRRKFMITGSRLPSLLGFYGNKKFTECWDTIMLGLNNENSLNGIPNIKRGHYYEQEAIEYLEKLSKSKTERCGFFKHPLKVGYGASPDALKN